MKAKKIEQPTIEWVNIPSGTFLMGSPKSEADRCDNEDRHKVSVNAFKMSKYAITFEQYDTFCDATNNKKPSDKGWGRGKHPVINVSWNDAKAFADWMGCRLPTEAEWEYACRAASSASAATTPFHNGNNLTTSEANYNGFYPYNKNTIGEHRNETMPVGSFVPNSWGLYDMHGNVWEWCIDTYKESYKSKEIAENAKLRFNIRGGSYLRSAGLCRSAFRNFDSPKFFYYDLGFRLASDE